MVIRNGWSSHIPVLIKVLLISHGPVLELGVGLFSTPLLHWVCLDQNRKLVSYENDPYYLRLCRSFINKNHEIREVIDWDKIDFTDTYWGMVLVDHVTERRIIEPRRLANHADYIICHDTQPEDRKTHNYDELFSEFKYVFHYTKGSPNTTVLSNFKDLKEFYEL